MDDRAEAITELRSLLDAGVIDSAEFERRRNEIGDRRRTHEVVAQYSQFRRYLLGAVVLLGIGGLFIWWIPNPGYAGNVNVGRVIVGVLAASFLAWGAALLVGAIRIWRSDRRALVINDEGIDVRLLLRNRFRVPWSEVAGVREREHHGENVDYKTVEIELRQPLRRFRVPPGKPRPWSRTRGRLGLGGFDISNERLIELIESRLETPAV
jgi:putative oligomerization/nucleic acid binding protein/PH (Pleckstrin Homology) domain-containing protein